MIDRSGHLDLQSLLAGSGLQQQGAAHWSTSVALLQLVDN